MTDLANVMRHGNNIYQHFKDFIRYYNNMKICIIESCGKQLCAYNYCAMHYRRFKLYGDPLKTLRIPYGTGTCSVPKCKNKYRSGGYCSKHYKQWLRTGNPIPTQYKSSHGSGYLDKNGYTQLYIDGRKQGLHRHVMEQYLGRFLTSDESVHHKNGDRSNNDLENLELWSRFQPAGQRVQDKITWAKEILSLYEPESLHSKPSQYH